MKVRNGKTLGTNTRKAERLAAATDSAFEVDPSHCVFRHVMRTSRAVAAEFDNVLSETGLTAGQFNLMMTLYREGENTVGQVARLIGMDATSVPRAAKPLIERGLLQQNSGEDRRVRLLALTPGGRRALLAAVPAWTRVQKSYLSMLSDTGWARAMVTLKQIRQTPGKPVTADDRTNAGAIVAA